MARVWIIADEITAAGFGLAGARVATPSADRLPEVFDTAREEAELILITADLARQLPAALVEETELSLAPMLLPIEGVGGHEAPPSMREYVMRTLGVST
jgi:vacuolar-type H+-ATPase subunit F/Vma7